MSNSHILDNVESFPENNLTLTAKDMMVKPIIIHENSSSKTILNRLKKEQINCCVVISKSKEYLGTITDSDIIKLFLQQVQFEPLVKLFNRGYRQKIRYQDAKSLLKKGTNVVYENTPLNEVIEQISKVKDDSIPVLSKDGKIKGIVTKSSIINLLKDK